MAFDTKIVAPPCAMKASRIDTSVQRFVCTLSYVLQAMLNFSALVVAPQYFLQLIYTAARKQARSNAAQVQLAEIG